MCISCLLSVVVGGEFHAWKQNIRERNWREREFGESTCSYVGWSSLLGENQTVKSCWIVVFVCISAKNQNGYYGKGKKILFL